MEKNEVKLTKGQQIGAELAGLLNGFGAGVLIGGVLYSVADAFQCGKVLKLIMKFGAFGLQIVTTRTVQKASEEWVKDAIVSIDKTKKLFETMSKPKQSGTVTGEGAVT